LPISWTPSYSFGRKKSVSLRAFRLRTPGMSCPSLGWTPRTLTPWFFDFRKRPPPVIVPHVPRPGDEVGDLPVGLLQISGPGRAEVGVRIGGVLVLVELVPARLLAHLGGLLHRPFGRAGQRAEVVRELDELRAERPERGPLLGRGSPATASP
jgi:hypothetical protein